MEVELNKILASTIESHMLYLYPSGIDKYDIQSAFHSFGKGKTVYISDNNPEKIKQSLPDIEVVKPENLGALNASRIIFDGESIKGNRLKHESILSRLKVPVLCTYPVHLVNKEDLKILLSCHDNMVLATESATVLSSKNFNEISFTEENIEKWVKKNLETIILALLLKKPMSGKDIIKIIHTNFNILISPGRLYPILHSFSKEGLLTCEYNIRDKVYSPVESGEIKKIVDKELQVSQLILNKFSSLEL